MNIPAVLHDIGLNDYERKIYAALLEHGESTSGQIMKQSGINSGRIYEILDKLEKKGLISRVTKNKIQYFHPVNPERAQEYLQERQKEFEKHAEEFRNILPELLARIKQRKEPITVEVFTGMKGLKVAYAKEMECAHKNSTLYIMSVVGKEKYPKELYDFFIYNQQPKRTAAGFKIKKLLGEGARSTREKYHEKQAQIKYLPYTSPVAITVIEDLAIIGIEIEEPVVITIESKDVADSFRKQFELLWLQAKK